MMLFVFIKKFSCTELKFNFKIKLDLCVQHFGRQHHCQCGKIQEETEIALLKCRRQKSGGVALIYTIIVRAGSVYTAQVLAILK